MNTPATAPIIPRLTAEQALRCLLELIRTSTSLADFTPERLQAVFGVPIQHWRENYYGYSERLTPQWTGNFSVDYANWLGAKEVRPRFELSFNHKSDTSPPMTDICQFDFEQFGAALTAMGYSHHPRYDSPLQSLFGEPPQPGPKLYETFFHKEQPTFTINVYSRRESRQNPDHICIKMITICDRVRNPRGSHVSP